jgi:y4mF family transcriptional regulator
LNPQIVPYGKISTPEEVGSVIRFRRKEIKTTQATVAGMSGVGERFLSELERGKSTVELGKALQVLNRLGLEVIIKPRRSGEQA